MQYLENSMKESRNILVQDFLIRFRIYRLFLRSLKNLEGMIFFKIRMLFTSQSMN